jgi:hypothetical protein
MNAFKFHGELFEVRTAVLNHLADCGFVWLSDFGAVDLQHDIYGLEVTAIRDEEDAKSIHRVLQKMLPDWRFARTFYEDQNCGELGWKVMISKQPEQFEDKRLARVDREDVQSRKNWITPFINSLLRRLQKAILKQK